MAHARRSARADPVLIVGLLLVGYQQQLVGYLLLGLGMPAVLIFSYWKVSHELLERWREQKAICYELQLEFKKAPLMSAAGAKAALTDGNETQVQLLCEHAFRLFDADESGQIDIYELRMMIHMIYPDLDRFQLSEMLHRLRSASSGLQQGSLEFAEFFEVLTSVRRILAEERGGRDSLAEASIKEKSRLGRAPFNAHAGVVPSGLLSRLRLGTGGSSLFGLHRRGKSQRVVSPDGAATAERRAGLEAQEQYSQAAESDGRPMEDTRGAA